MNFYENAEIVSIPELTKQYDVDLEEKYYKLYNRKEDGTLGNFFVLESFNIRVLFKKNEDIIDKGIIRINNIKEYELSKMMFIDKYNDCFYTDQNITQLFKIENNNHIYKKLRMSNFNTICFDL